jgi:serine/threonine-protein kinase RsbT
MSQPAAPAAPPLSVRVKIVDDSHAVAAAQLGRQMGGRLGLSPVQQTALATAILEIARNIVKYAHDGELTLEAVYDGARQGVRVTARDSGPGLPDIEQAMRDGFSTGRSLGLGLPGARRLMDSFTLESLPGSGTTVVMTKWLA